MGLFTGMRRLDAMREGYGVYGRLRPGGGLTYAQYRDVVRRYCEGLADELRERGIVDLPYGLGSIVAVSVRRRPRYDPKAGRYRPASPVDWKATKERGEVVRDDTRETFGLTFSAERGRGKANLRCFGFQADGALFMDMKRRYDGGTLGFPLPDIDDFEI